MNSHTRPIVLAALSGAALAATAHAQPYERAIGDQNQQRSDWVIAVNDSDDPGAAHAGWTGDTINADMYIARLKSAGDTLWDTRIGNPDSTDVANRIEHSQTPDDGFLVAGETGVLNTPGAVPFGISLTRLDANGNMLWSQLYQGTPFAGGSFGGTGLDVHFGGRALLCGRLQLQQFADQGAVLHNVDASGAQIWGKYYADALVGQPSFNSFHDAHVVTDPDGDVFIYAVGYAAPASFSSRDTLVLKLDLSGAVIWANTYGPQNHTDVAMGLEPAANGELLVTGYTKEAGEGGGTYIMRIRPDGTLLWWKDYRFIDASNSIHEEANGDIVVAGTANDFNGTQDLGLMRTDASGNVLWARAYGGDQREYGEAVGISADGYVLSAWTESFLFGSFDLYALAADTDGRTGCERDWDVIATPRQHPVAGHLYRGHDIPEQITPPFEQDFPLFANERVCDDDPDPCPTCAAQWAPPVNVSDFSDVVAFLNAYSVCDPCAAQLAPPQSSCDFNDVIAFLNSFAQPCP